jgi:hypothetical protein
MGASGTTYLSSRSGSIQLAALASALGLLAAFTHEEEMRYVKWVLLLASFTFAFVTLYGALTGKLSEITIGDSELEYSYGVFSKRRTILFASITQIVVNYSDRKITIMPNGGRYFELPELTLRRDQWEAMARTLCDSCRKAGIKADEVHYDFGWRSGQG